MPPIDDPNLDQAQQPQQPQGPQDGPIKSTAANALALVREKSYSPDMGGQPGGGGGEETPAAAQGAPQAAASPAPTGQVESPAIETPTSNVIDLSGYKPNAQVSGIYSQLFGDIEGKAQNQFGKLEGMAGKFSEQAGGFRDWGGIGGEATMKDVFSKAAAGTATDEEIQAARDLASASYKGPAELRDVDEAGFDELAAAIAGSYGEAPLYTSLEGIGDLVGQKQEGLTPGEMKFQRGALARDTGYRQAAAGVQNDIQNVYRALQSGTKQASAIGAQRKGQEADISTKARALGEGRQGEILAGVDADVAKAQGEQDAFNTAWGKFKETGSLDDLAKVPGLQFDPKALNTTARQESGAAQKAATEIGAQFQDIADLPLLELEYDTQGRERLQQEPTWAQEMRKKGVPEAEVQAKLARVRERQQALVDAGFAAGDRYWKDRYTSVLNDPNAYKGSPEELMQGSKYGLYMPLYFGQGMAPWQPENLDPYLQVKDQNGQITRETMIGESRRREFNAINSILDKLSSDIADADPYTAATVAAEVERYLADEEASLNERRGVILAGQNEWREAVRSQRRKYEEAKKNSIWGKVASNALMSLGGGAGGPSAYELVFGESDPITASFERNARPGALSAVSMSDFTGTGKTALSG